MVESSAPPPATARQPFDPFNHRLSRDLRNDLAKALLAALAAGKTGPVLATAARYRNRPGLGPELVSYLDERLACYLAVLAEVRRGEETEPDRLALALWNHELFFEFHELLEQRWLRAAGVEKAVLQALIRAAGTYIHRRYGHAAGAAKMAARARQIIEIHRRHLPPGFAAGPLLAALAEPDAPPPKFRAIDHDAKTVKCRHGSEMLERV
jgi:hypothetical protein